MLKEAVAAVVDRAVDEVDERRREGESESSERARREREGEQNEKEKGSGDLETWTSDVTAR